jgi:hypothetical protein
MPSYTTISEVRSVAGVSESSDISDANLEKVIDIAERYMIDDIIIWISDEKLIGNIDNSNTKFETRNEPIGDREVLGALSGSPADVTVYSHIHNSTEPDDYSELTVSSVDRRRGEVILESAPSSSVDEVLADYGYYDRPIREDQLKNAATYLTAHLVSITMERPDKVTFADIEENSMVIEQNPTRFLKRYKKQIRKASGDEIVGVGL